mmetsp:Transcript_31534/g.52983  ORF Transcript_31534/g.52983 Transcript_31534/m.52983 type:complete len:291 (+) Transcript_31534:245-1117(+)|eukprot:CAMPEP_0198218702 /NCGR_PEP_ID=MMETSP1445-20131203/70684_1 /TAXON_ID=36898 /ORGANISM="Pyramimonas sp., Strain CCMP2087" /LENGTH=290 /DNA_ID=CAMNT_0043895855 /DNA_START=192 /DNA_END=1064 /DNA_ORIENTATION=+
MISHIAIFVVVLVLSGVPSNEAVSSAVPSWHPHAKARAKPSEEAFTPASTSISTSSGRTSISTTQLVGVLMGEDTTMDIQEAARIHNANVKNPGGGCSAKGGKVFNFGLPRTGTLSLTDVTKQIGFANNCHQITDWQWKDVQEFNLDVERGDSIVDAVEKCDAMSDIPTYGMWRSLAKAYPTARLILTTRGVEEWLSSTQKLLNFWAPRLRADYGDFHAWYFGNGTWEREPYRANFRKHHQEILEALGDRVLVLASEMSDEEKVSSFLQFMGCKVKTPITFATKPVGKKA